MVLLSYPVIWRQTFDLRPWEDRQVKLVHVLVGSRVLFSYKGITCNELPVPSIFEYTISVRPIDVEVFE